ncbi:unnamed protein product [Closterium sp. NIES-54]
MRQCSGSGVIVPLFAIRQRTSSPPALFPASSLAFPLTRLAGSFTTPPRAVFSPLKMSRFMSRSPPVDPLPPQGPAPSGVSQVDPLPRTVSVQVAIDSGAARDTRSGGAASSDAEPASAEPGGNEPAGVEPGGAEFEGAEPGGPEPKGAEPGGAESEGAESGGAEPRGSATGGTGAGGAGATRLGGAGVPAEPRGTGGAGAAAPGGARTRGTGATGAGGVGGAGGGGVGAGDPGAGGAGAGGTGAGGTVAGGAGAGGAGAGDPGARGAGAGGAGARGAASGDTGAACTSVVSLSLVLPRLFALFAQVIVFLVRVLLLSPGFTFMALRPSCVPLDVPLSPPPESSLPAAPDPESDLAHAASPTVLRLLATVVTDSSFESTAASAPVPELVDFAAACRFDYATSLVVESESGCPPSVGGECALSTDVLEDRQEDFECLAAAVPHLMTMLLAPEGDQEDIPTLRSYAEAITGPYSSQWQTAMDAEMASWNSTGTYIDAVPPYRANIVDGMWIFSVKWPPGSPRVFKARYIARGFRQQQGVDFF